MKITNWILTALFAAFAFVQLNDPDPLKWIILYGGVAAISAMAALGKYNRYLLFAAMSVCLIWLLTLIPDIADWIRRGMPSIVGSMKAETPYVELAREFFGVVVCGGALVWHWVSGRRSRLV